MFTDIYERGDLHEGYPRDDSPKAVRYEFELIEFHFARVRTKRGIGSGPAQIDHFAERQWRFHSAMLMGNRGDDAVRHMVRRHLLETIRRCGPVGKPPVNRRGELRLCLTQMDERIRWAERNSLRFKDEASGENSQKFSNRRHATTKKGKTVKKFTLRDYEVSCVDQWMIRARSMPNRPASITVYLEPSLDKQLEVIRNEIASKYVKYSKTKIVELAIRQFVNRYQSDLAQFELDLDLDRR